MQILYIFTKFQFALAASPSVRHTAQGRQMPDSDPRCAKCGKVLTTAVNATDTGNHYCRTCLLELAGQMVSESDTREKKKKESIEKTRSLQRRLPLMIKWACLFAALGILAFRMQYITASLQKDKPLRQGTYDTNTVTDNCIQNLWIISSRMRSGDFLTADLTCPLSAKPYRSELFDERITVLCPNAQLHNLMELKVSQDAPVPVVR